MMRLSQGQVLGRYELLLPIARGGMAEVWAARLHGSRGFTKLVAIKTILQGVTDNARMEQMFLAEAGLASRIHHPNVVQTLELGEQDGLLFLVLEWVEGESLSSLFTHSEPHGGIPLKVGVNLVGQACKGLHAAHELTDEHGCSLGVVHRDISPQNILVTFSGTAKVADFGIAKAAENASTLTEAGEVKGKLAYMAPEQLEGAHPVDRRADVFAMGTLLYLLTARRHPFRGDHPGTTLKNITSPSSAPPPSAHLEDYPPELEQVVLTALRKNPDERYGTALELLRALERAVPEALESSFEVKVADFVTQVAVSGGNRRQQEIRRAGEILDRIRSEASARREPTGPSSLSALSIDGRDRAERQLPDSPEALSAQVQFRPRHTLGKLLALGLAAVVVGGSLGLMLAEEPPTAPTTYSLASVKAAASEGKPLASATETAPAVVESAPAIPARAPERPRAAAPRLTRLHRALPRTPALTPTTSAPAQTTAVPVTSASSKRNSKAWDPDAFGARQ